MTTMTFMHKLSRRLALLMDRRAILVAVALIAIADCERPVSVAGPGTTLAQLVVVPPTVSLLENTSTDFVALGLTTAGDTVAVAVNWTATGGQISDSTGSTGLNYGVYSAGAQTGQFTVAAHDPTSGKSATATAVVTTTAAPVASVVVLPAAATASVGGTTQFVAIPLAASGTALGGRVVTWASSNTVVATVDGSGLATGVATGSATITATSEGKSGSSTITVTAVTVPVATVSVSPASGTVFVGQTLQLTATPKDANGNALTGRTITWASTATAIASVNGGGLVTGQATGSATITATSEGKSGNAGVTVTTAPPPPTGTCLTQTGPLVTLSGLQTSTYEPSNLADFTRIDATTAQFLLDTSVNVIAREGGGANICWSGGEILGQSPPSTPWNTMHDRYAMIPGSHSSAVRITIENYTAFSWGKGISFDDPGIDSGFTIRNVHVKYGRDDCIEDDFFNGGTIDSTFLDGCYDAVSSQEDPGATQGVNNIITISNSLLRLQAMDSVYSGPVPNHNAFWKWSDLAPSLQLYNNVFRADGPSQEGNGARMYMAPPPGKLADCKNNVMVWLGSGPFPETLPTTFNGQPCFTLMTGTAGLQYWNNAVATWFAHHPDPLPDVAPPIVSLFSPGITGNTTLTGTDTLIATANDDRAVAGVQFQLNGQNIGAEVTQDGVSGDDQFGPTKYVLTWDSHGVANGSYTLTAVARDAAGHSTTSAGVTVTVSN